MLNKQEDSTSPNDLGFDGILIGDNLLGHDFEIGVLPLLFNDVTIPFEFQLGFKCGNFMLRAR
jgi:hypothetical protein